VKLLLEVEMFLILNWTFLYEIIIGNWLSYMKLILKIEVFLVWDWTSLSEVVIERGKKLS